MSFDEEVVKNNKKYLNRTNLLLNFGGFLVLLIYCMITGENYYTTAPAFILIIGVVIGLRIASHKK